MNLTDGMIVRHLGAPDVRFLFRGEFRGRAKLEALAGLGGGDPYNVVVPSETVFSRPEDQPIPPMSSYPSAPSLPPQAPPPPKSYKQPKTHMSELLAVRNALTAAADVFQWARETKDYKYESFTTLDPSEIRDALIRHLLETGHDHQGRDAESKRLHAVHVLNNALMYLEVITRMPNYGKPA